MDKKRLAKVAAGVVILVLVGGAGIAYATGGDSGERVTGPGAEKAGSAALRAVGGGTVTEVEREDGAGAFEVEVERDDGRQVEVHLDGDLDVLARQPDDDGTEGVDGPNDD